MSLNLISWRRIRTLNDQLGGETFVHAVVNSSYQHWYWTCMRIDGSSATVDTQSLTVEENTEPVETTTERLLRDRSTATERDAAWLRELDERARHLPQGTR